MVKRSIIVTVYRNVQSQPAECFARAAKTLQRNPITWPKRGSTALKIHDITE